MFADNLWNACINLTTWLLLFFMGGGGGGGSVSSYLRLTKKSNISLEWPLFGKFELDVESSWCRDRGIYCQIVKFIINIHPCSPLYQRTLTSYTAICKREKSKQDIPNNTTHEYTKWIEKV